MIPDSDYFLGHPVHASNKSDSRQTTDNAASEL